jgi:hypothetical protein
MREILFRGQHRRYGEQVNMAGEKLPPVWVYGGVLQGEGDFSIIYGSKSPDGKFEEKYSVYTETLGQYTGLDDVTGSKIFEGDVINAQWRSRSSAEVVFESGMFKAHGMSLITWIADPFYRCKIIGNIYDNPELLKEAT